MFAFDENMVHGITLNCIQNIGKYPYYSLNPKNTEIGLSPKFGQNEPYVKCQVNSLYVMNGFSIVLKYEVIKVEKNCNNCPKNLSN